MTLVLFLAVFAPSMSRVRRTARGQTCAKNLNHVGIAFRTWTGSGDGTFSTRTSTNFGGTKELVGSGMVFVHFQAMSNELSAPDVLICPLDKDKAAVGNFGPGLSDSNVGYFISVDAQDINPKMFLAGDRNLTANGIPVKAGILLLSTNNVRLGWSEKLHHGCGNVLLADGSVRRLDGAELMSAVSDQWWQWRDTNRLVVP